MKFWRHLGVFLGCAALGLGLGAAEKPRELTRTESEFFEKKVRPILVRSCYSCHSAQAEKLKGGLMLDTRDGVLKGGELGAVIVPGEPDKSRLIHAVRQSDADLRMPPKEILPADQIADLEQWVKMGAPDPRTEKALPKGYDVTKHWAFQPMSKPSVTRPKDGWARQDLDTFILAALEKQKLKPAGRADGLTLLRRATFDLTGLPPTLEEIRAFQADKRSDAFEKAVDRLLASPRFGERWGRHWLDVARYADSNGLEVNTPYPNAWRYRDYVIKAFNEDKPWDRFIHEQVAGDLLMARTDEERYALLTATGFLALGPKILSEPNQEKLQMDVVDEQIDVTTRGLMGLTVSCARCHDHKFDPVPTRDYYALAGFFKSTKTMNTRGENPGQNVPWNEVPLAPPAMAEALRQFETNVAMLQGELNALREQKKDLPGGIDSKELPGVVVDNMAAEATGSWKESNYSTNFVDKNYLHDGGTGKGKNVITFRPNLPTNGMYEVLIAYTPRLNRATNVPVKIEGASGPKTVTLNQRLEPTHEKAFRSVGQFQFLAGTNGSVTLSTEGTRGFVVADAVQFLAVTSNMMAMGSEQMKPGKKTRATLLGMSPEEKEMSSKLVALQEKRPPALPTAMAVQEGTAQNSRIHLKGEVTNLGQEAPRGFLTALKFPHPTQTYTNSGRQELAAWMTNPENPLTARVWANRVWQHLMGRGLVDTVDNFGVLGEAPSHPELLDHLAQNLIVGGWSTKNLIKQVMLSSTYQLSSQFDADGYAIDPANIYYWRMARKRLEVEPLRDAMLAVSGQLDLTMGGSATEGASAMDMRPNRTANSLNGKRRSVYLPIVRNEISDMFQAFDFADPHSISGKRYATTGAPQALFMMNSTFVQEQSDKWGAQLAAQEGNQIEDAFLTAFGRPPGSAERQAAMKFLANHEQSLSRHIQDAEARRLSAWQNFAQALFGATEFRFLD